MAQRGGEMMSILIKGMEPQESCIQCSFYNEVGCTASGRMFPRWTNIAVRQQDCPLIELPPHGRVIDADAFVAEMKKRREEAGKWLREAKDRETAARADAVLSFLCEVKLTLDKMPTIIEAEG